jgi:hypothetical protein
MLDLQFHHGHFTSQPFLNLNHCFDWCNQALYMGFVILQPRLGTYRDSVRLELD